MTLSNYLVLYEYCKNCTLLCCKGTPRVSEEEKTRILENTEVNFFAREKLGYYVTQQNNGFCKYLTNRKCSVQRVKPVDCQLFPIDPIFDEDYNISFVIESSCPACKERLTPEFIATAILFSADWIKEFSFEQFIDYWGKYKLSNPKHKIIDLRKYLEGKDANFKEQIKKILTEIVEKNKNIQLKEWGNLNKIILPF